MGSPIIMIALDVINTLLFLIAGIATAAILGVHSCSNQVSFTRQVFTTVASAQPQNSIAVVHVHSQMLRY